MSRANSSRWTTELAALDANLLVALDALLAEANVTRAARRIGITQSAMSQSLARLRRLFDDPILAKSGRHLEPTPFARRISDRLHRAMRELEAVVRDRPAFDPATAVRRFVLATVDYLALVLVPPLQAALAAQAPRVDLAVHAPGGEPVTPLLAAGVVDLYVGVEGAAERGLQTSPLFSESLVAVMRPGHPLRRGKLTARAYADALHVHISPRRDASSIVDRALAAEGLARRIAVEVPYFGVLPQLLGRSDLVATVPWRMAAWLEREHGFAFVEVPLPLPAIEICVAWHPTFARDPGVAWLRERVVEVAGAG